MAVERYTFDTNILFYSLDARDPDKHARARKLIGLADAQRVPILLQSLGELSNSIIKRSPALLPQAERLIQLTSVMFTVVPAEFDDLSDALLIHKQHNLQFWDAVLWATARRAGCATLLTEDMQAGRTLGGVTILNPFKMSSGDFDAFLS
jgi:predicted nucleic acid-binding protein